jgi:hypothetical protein
MAKLNLTFYDLPVTPTKDNEPNMTLSTEICSSTVGINCNQMRNFTFSLVDVQMVKQMYLPAEIIATISITKAGNYNWIDRKKLQEVFSHKRVEVVVLTKEKDNKDRIDVIGEDYYVHEVIPVYMHSSMEMKLKIYSPDKLMTLRKTCRSFVGKRLGEDILSKEMKTYVKPYNSFVSQYQKKTETNANDNATGNKELGYNTDNMRILKYESVKQPDKIEEHIFPYLVQYNESFYDMLARTCNRWGEFMFWEDGKLQIGYDIDSPIISAGRYYKLTYPSLNDDEELVKAESKNYDCAAVYEENLTKPYEYSPWKAHHLVFKELDHITKKRWDVFTMRKMAAYLNNDKSLWAFVGEAGVNDLVSFTYHSRNYTHQNDLLNDKYFPENGSLGLPEQNDDQYQFNDGDKAHKAFNQFTEIDTAYKDDFPGYTNETYSMILDAEQEASKSLALIDYDTTYPADVKLGTILQVDNNELFIVTGISAQTVKSGDSSKLVFSLEVIAQNPVDNDFYPACLPSGHVRLSGPQKAKVVETKDPCLQNRVRVLFTWQQDDKNAEPTPWIPFSASGDGAATTGRHPEGLDVIVGYIDGNMERPYVMGAIQEDRSLIGATDVDLDTPWGHHLRLSDGIGNGFEKFVSGTFSPLSKTVLNMLPGTPPMDFGRQRCLEGGFTLSDYYGVYSISGSTEDRNISIQSPWGDVKINAFTGITIDAPNGDVNIKGKNITLEAGNNLKLVSGANIEKYFVRTDFNPLIEISVAAATKLLKLLGGAIDFSVLRAAIEVGFRPVEGVLELQSYRYLKLEAGGTLTGYPDEAYKDKRAIAYSKMKDNEWYRMGTAIAEMTRKMRTFVSDWQGYYKTRYVKALKARKAFDQSIKDLRYYSNIGSNEYDDQQVKICNGYDDLKNKFCDAKTTIITATDLGFKANIVGSKENSDVNLACTIRTSKGAAKIRSIRKQKKINVVNKANDLLRAIQALRKMELDENEVRNGLGNRFHFTKRLPKNYIDAVIKAFSKEKCKKSSIYNDWVGRDTFNLNDDEYNNLRSQQLSGDKSRALARLAALNLLDEFGFKAKNPNFNAVAGAANAVANNAKDRIKDLPELFASEDELINNWNEKINNLVILTTAGIGLLPKILDSDLKKTAKDLVDNWTFRKVREHDIWSDAKDGKILFSSGKTPTRSLDGQINNVDTFYSKGKLHQEDLVDGEKQDVQQFNRALKDALLSYNLQPIGDEYEIIGPENNPQDVVEPVQQPAEGNPQAQPAEGQQPAGGQPQGADQNAVGNDIELIAHNFVDEVFNNLKA